MPKKKIARINLNTFDYRLDSVQDSYLNLGGRGLLSNIIAQEVPPECDPLGKDNKLVIAAGLLSGTPIHNSGRLSFGAKSPLTQTIKEVSTGGTAALKLARLGIQALVFEGVAAEQIIIKINDSGIVFTKSDKTSFIASDNIEFFESNDPEIIELNNFIVRLRAEHGEHVGIICIWPTEEIEFLNASITVSTQDFYPRIVAGGGMGAIMEAKNIKAIIIDDRYGTQPHINDVELFKKSLKNLTDALSVHKALFSSKKKAVFFKKYLSCNLTNYREAVLQENRFQEKLKYAERVAALNTLGLSLYALIPTLDVPDIKNALIECISAILDEPLNEDYLERLGQMVIQTENKFNNAAGVKGSDDTYLDFLLK